MSEELKPCPFCGGEADPEGWMNGDGECGPECESCGATASSVIVWNRRAELAALKAGQGEAVAYVLFRDGSVCYEADDNIVISNVPGDETDLYKWRPVYTAPPASADAVSVPVELLKRTIMNLLYGSARDNAEELRALLAQSESKGVKS